MTDAANSLEELKSVMDFIHTQTNGLAVPTGQRQLIVLGCQDIAIEHAAGIMILADHQTWAPAFALLRPMFDSYVRGVWLAVCATDDQLRLFEADKLRHTVQFKSMVDAVEANFVTSTILTSLHKTAWALMSDFNHTGPAHVIRRLSSKHVGPNYPPQEIEQALRLAASFALLAAIFTADVAENAPVVKALQVRAKLFATTRLGRPL